MVLGIELCVNYMYREREEGRGKGMEGGREGKREGGRGGKWREDRDAGESRDGPRERVGGGAQGGN